MKDDKKTKEQLLHELTSLRRRLAQLEEGAERQRMEEALRDNEQFLTEIFNSIQDGLSILDPELNIIRVNPAMEKFGYTQPLVGKKCYEAYLDRRTPSEVCPSRQTLRTAKPCRAIVTEVAADGSHRFMEIYSLPMIDRTSGRVQGVIEYVRNVTARQQAEDTSKLNELRLEALLKLNQMAEAPLQEIAAFALEEAIRLTGSTIGYLAFVNEDESVLTMHAWSKNAMEECRIVDKPRIYPLETTGLWGEAVRQRQAIITNDYAAANPWKKGCPPGHVQIARHVNAPIFDGKKIVIVAGMGNKPSDYNESDVRQLTLLMEGMWRIVQRKRTEEALRESEARFRSLFDSMTEGVALHELVYDDQGVAVDYRLVSTNPAFEKHTGLKGELIHGQLASLTYGTGTAPFLELYAQVGHSGQAHVFETFFPPMERHFHISVTSPKQGQFVTVFEDITRRKRLEETLRDNEQFLTDIFNSIQDGLSILDPELNIIRVNPAMEKFGYTQPLAGRKCYEVYHGQSSPCEVCPTQQTLLTGKVCRETVKGPPSGPERVMEVLTFPLKDRTTGQIQAVIEYVRDVTESKRAEDERLRLSKLESLATLAGGIAHDFNNILTAIMGNISLALLELEDEGQSRERLAGAERACLQAQTLARQLLTFARGGAPVKEPVSMEKIAIESASFSIRGSQVRCKFDFPGNLWTVEADSGQINQVFQNLIINAIQAMPMGGTIKIRGENLTLEAGDDPLLNQGRYVKVSVEDQGVGVPAEYLPKIFDPYFTTKQSGSGLGLATTYSIVKNHHGLISAESISGKGTVFNVYLPASDKKMTTMPEENRDLLSGQGKILVMDDEEVVRQVLAIMLGRLGYEGEFTRDGNDALELFTRAREAGRAFDAVILDLTVPGGMGGKEVMEKLLKIDPQVKAIVSSGYSEAPIMAEFEKYGFSGIIAKPYKVSDLGRVLNKVCNGGG